MILCVILFNGCSNKDSIFIGQEWYLIQEHYDYNEGFKFTGIKSELWFKNDSLYVDNNQKLFPLIHLNDTMLKVTYKSNDTILTDTIVHSLIELKGQQFLMIKSNDYDLKYFLLLKSSINNPNPKIYNYLDFKIDGFSIGDTIDKSLLIDIERNEYFNHISEAKSISNNIEFEIVNDLIYSIKHLEIDPNDVNNLLKILNEKCGFRPDTVDERLAWTEFGYKWENKEYNIRLTYEDKSEFYKDNYFRKSIYEDLLWEEERNKFWKLEYDNYMLQKFIISNCDDKTYSVNIE